MQHYKRGQILPSIPILTLLQNIIFGLFCFHQSQNRTKKKAFNPLIHQQYEYFVGSFLMGYSVWFVLYHESFSLGIILEWHNNVLTNVFLLIFKILTKLALPSRIQKILWLNKDMNVLWALIIWMMLSFISWKRIEKRTVAHMVLLRLFMMWAKWRNCSNQERCEFFEHSFVL